MPMDQENDLKCHERKHKCVQQNVGECQFLPRPSHRCVEKFLAVLNIIDLYVELFTRDSEIKV